MIMIQIKGLIQKVDSSKQYSKDLSTTERNKTSIFQMKLDRKSEKWCINDMGFMWHQKIRFNLSVRNKIEVKKRMQTHGEMSVFHQERIFQD